MNDQFLISTASYMQVDTTGISKDSCDESGLATLPSLNIELDSCMSLTTPVRYTPRSSPPMFCRDRKRLRRSLLNSNFAQENPKLNFVPELDDDEDLRKPKKRCLVQRLTHPYIKEIDSFKSPTPTKYTSTSSMPMLRRDGNHFRQKSLDSNFAESYPKLNFPDLDGEDLGRPKKYCIAQRLTHPDVMELNRTDLRQSSASSSSNRRVSFSLCTPKEDPCKQMKRSSSVKIGGNIGSRHTILFGIDNYGKQIKFQRHLSSSALTA
jgi:hypothetical protein